MNPRDPVKKHFRLLPDQEKALGRLGITTILDLLYHFPSRYTETSELTLISDITAGEHASIYATARSLKLEKGYRSKIPMAKATIEDGSGKIQAVWFHQPYIAKMLKEGVPLKFSGKVTEGKSGIYLSNPEFEELAGHVAFGNSLFKGDNIDASIAYPVYPESRGISSKWMYHAIQKIFKSGMLDALEDPIPSAILAKYHLPQLKSALVWIHTPKNMDHTLSARKRFSFEEVFFIQLQKQKDRLVWKNEPAFIINAKEDPVDEFIDRFPFDPTAAQKKAVADILSDFERGHAMLRLLEGDVGSGKTAVAAATAYAVITTRPANSKVGALQVAYMAPTEILATQHFESFSSYFAYKGVQVGLITGSGCKKFPSKVSPTTSTPISRSQLLKWVANGEIQILVGTHALIQKAVKFKDLAYVIIDEQHRFGTAQRKSLVRKDGLTPHLLSMTATPIPRTLALTVFGDLDLTILDQMPHGRKPIITEIVPPTKRDGTYELIRKELARGKQAYVICPRIDEPDPSKEMAVEAKSVKEESKRLKKYVFQEYEIGMLHGKMTPKEKERIMDEFTDGSIDILVATSLVEVGVNVPNATVIVIEGAERFGLAQLHQLRGRVIRSNDQAYCYVFSNTKSQKSMERLKALKTAKNGFELAELDLAQRGAGELGGGKQWGVSDIAMEALKNIKMVEAARTEAREIIEKDSELINYPLLQQRVTEEKKTVHFE